MRSAPASRCRRWHRLPRRALREHSEEYCKPQHVGVLALSVNKLSRAVRVERALSVNKRVYPVVERRHEEMRLRNRCIPRGSISPGGPVRLAARPWAWRAAARWELGVVLSAAGCSHALSCAAFRRFLDTVVVRFAPGSLGKQFPCSPFSSIRWPNFAVS